MAFVAFSSLENGALFIHQNHLWRKEVLSQSNTNAFLEEFYKKSGTKRFDDAILVKPCTKKEWQELCKIKQEASSTKVVLLRQSGGRFFHG